MFFKGMTLYGYIACNYVSSSLFCNRMEDQNAWKIHFSTIKCPAWDSNPTLPGEIRHSTTRLNILTSLPFNSWEQINPQCIYQYPLGMLVYSTVLHITVPLIWVWIPLEADPGKFVISLDEGQRFFISHSCFFHYS